MGLGPWVLLERTSGRRGPPPRRSDRRTPSILRLDVASRPSVRRRRKRTRTGPDELPPPVPTGPNLTHTRHPGKESDRESWGNLVGVGVGMVLRASHHTIHTPIQSHRRSSVEGLEIAAPGSPLGQSERFCTCPSPASPRFLTGLAHVLDRRSKGFLHSGMGEMLSDTHRSHPQKS